MSDLRSSPIPDKPHRPSWVERTLRVLFDWITDYKAMREKLTIAEAKLAKLDRWIVGDRESDDVADEMLSIAKQYQNVAWRLACCHPDEDGCPAPDDVHWLDSEEWWGTVSECLERAEAKLQVTGEKSETPNEGDSEWYAYDPDVGYETFATADEARSWAEDALEDQQDLASDDGWSDDIGSLQWGRLDVQARAVCVKRTPSEDSRFDEYQEWELRPVTGGEGGVMSFFDEVLAERWRQATAEGWTAEHDDQWTEGQLAAAASCYAAADDYYPPQCPPGWPWDWIWWKPKDRRFNLVRAAALLLAEGDRLDRLEVTEKPTTPATTEDEIEAKVLGVQDADDGQEAAEAWSRVNAAREQLLNSIDDPSEYGPIIGEDEEEEEDRRCQYCGRVISSDGTCGGKDRSLHDEPEAIGEDGGEG